MSVMAQRDDRVEKMGTSPPGESQRAGGKHAYTRRIIIMYTKGTEVSPERTECRKIARWGWRVGTCGGCGERHQFSHEDPGFSPHFGGGERGFSACVNGLLGL